MTSTHNILLFRLEAFHDYFSHGLCNCLHFTPGETTRALQQRYGFLQDRFKNGFEWFANTRVTIQERLDYITRITGATSFDFDINSKNDSFYEFTQLPAGWAGQFGFESGKTNASQSGMELQPQLSASVVDGPIGKLSIAFSDIISAGTDAKPVYTIRFTARTTQWQYYVVNSSQVPLNQPLVKGVNGDAFEFLGPETVQLANGQQALLFTSGTRLIPLCEMPKTKFSLLNRPAFSGNGSSAKPVFRNLPQPDPKNWAFVQVNGARQTASLMYVYL